MNGKRITSGLGAVLLCTSLIAYGADPPRNKTAAFTPNSVATATGTPLAELRDVPANDACENAEAVTGPYPVTVCGTTEGATADCPDTLNWNAVWYAVELPYAANKLVVDYCATADSLSAYQVGTLYLNSCSDCATQIYGTYQWHDCGNGQSNPAVVWNSIPGPTTIMLPVYINPGHAFCAEIDVTEILPPPNDTCENAELITGPYPTTVCGTTLGATLDCPGVMDWNAVWYEVTLPYAINTVETDYCATETSMSGDEIGIVYSSECCGDAVVGSYTWQSCPNYNWNPKVWWRDVPGPGTILIPVYVNPAHDFCFDINVRDGDCTVTCPPNAVAENEACGADLNGGCNMARPNVEPLACNETVCGTGWADGGTRDTDWYEVTVTEPTTMTFTVNAEFITGVIAGMMEPATPGVVGCDQLTGVVNPYATGVDCEEITITYDAMPGTYWWIVAPNGYEGLPCGAHNNYTATMTCTPWEVRGACCDDSTGTCTDNVLYQDCAEPLRFTKDKLCSEIAPPCGGCPESMIEIQINTDRYANETTWAITAHDDPNVVIASGGPYDQSYATYFEYVCVGTSDCVDFTIYDFAGDGQSWGPGGYAVRLDGVELYSTLDTSWSGFEQTCGSVGRGCGLGRCCYTPWPGCVDTTLFDCVSTYGGLWAEGLNCTDNPCQNPDAPDFEVTAPYTSPQRTTCGALDRCHPVDQYYDTPEHVYRVTIPYDGIWTFNTCQDNSNATWLSVGTTLCGVDIGWSAWACNGLAAEVVAYVTAGDYYVDVEGYQQCGTYILDVHEVPVCDVACPPNATIEAEACGDSTNNGCWTWPNAFETIYRNETICGQTYYEDGTYDGDFYEYVALADEVMTFTVRSNVSVEFGLVEQYVPGLPGCDNISGSFSPSAMTINCSEASVSFPVTAGNTYYVYVGYGFNNPESLSYAAPCGTLNDYVATLTGSLCGDLDGDGDVDADDYKIFADAFGGPVDGVPPQDADCDYDGSGAVGMADFAAWLQCYRDFIGDPTAAAPAPKPEPARELHQQRSLLGNTLVR